ncbi:hypothetical protein GCM10009624_02090 [Gordonia sinesedis]
MTRMTRGVVEKAHPELLGPAAESLEPVSRMIEQNAVKMHRTVTDLDWTGDARASAVGRVDDERTQMIRVADAADRLANSFKRGRSVMAPMVASLRSSASNLEGAGFRVADNWRVTDGWDYGMAEAFAAGNSAKLQRIAAIKRERADEAVNQTVRLQRLAQELEDADTATAAQIRSASGAIAAMAPVAAGMSAKQADRDVDALRNGTATPAQLARLRMATRLSDEQVQALREGRRIALTQGQFDYLTGMMKDLDGVSMQEMLKMNERAPGLLGDAMRLASNPKLGTESGDRGGMKQLPPQVQSLLRDSPLKTNGTFNATYGGTEVNRRMWLYVPRLDEFEALNKLLASRNPSGGTDLRLGTDIDRGLVKQASEMSRIFGPRMTTSAGEPYGSPANIDDIRRVVNGMLTTSGGDHQAITDFLTGENMDVTVTQGNTFNADRHFLDLLKAKWGDDNSGMKAAFDWTGSAADDGGLEGRMGGRAAEEIAKAFVRHHDELAYIGESAPGSPTEAFGTRNPELAQMFAKNLVPYWGNLANLPSELLINHTAGPLGTTSELSSLVGILGTDPVAAETLVHGSARWEAVLAHQYGLSPGSDIGTHSGQLNSALVGGLEDGKEVLVKNHDWVEQISSTERATRLDQVLGLLSAIPLPGVAGDAYGVLGATLSPEIKADILGLQNDPRDSKIPAINSLDELLQTHNQLTQGNARLYYIADGVSERHPEWWGVPQTGDHGRPVTFFNSAGDPIWSAIVENPKKFETFISRVGISDLDDEFETDYSKGSRDTTLDERRRFPPVPSAAERPRGATPHDGPH